VSRPAPGIHIERCAPSLIVGEFWRPDATECRVTFWREAVSEVHCQQASHQELAAENIRNLEERYGTPDNLFIDEQMIQWEYDGTESGIETDALHPRNGKVEYYIVDEALRRESQTARHCGHPADEEHVATEIVRRKERIYGGERAVLGAPGDECILGGVQGHSVS
jgi:hypothetical protein